MSNVRSYLKEKEKRTNSGQEGFADKIKKHKMKLFYRISLTVLLIGAVIFLVYYQYEHRTYTSLEVINSKERSVISGTRELSLGSKIMTYSSDGAHCADAEGNALWNQTFEMQNPIVATCQDVVAIADYNGSTVYVMNSEKKLGEINTAKPIRNLCVAGNGVVAVVLEEAKVTWVNLYDSQGNELVTHPTRMKNTGYPTAISISEDAKLMAIGYTYLDTGVLKTRVAFYNFDSVGENEVDRLVSGYDYTDTFVPYIQYMNSDTAFAVADNRLMIYEGSEVPETKAEVLLDEEIQSVCYSENYIGLVFYGNSGVSEYKLRIFNTAAQEVVSIPFQFDSIADARIFFQQDRVVIYSETECMIFDMSGQLKYAGSFDKSVRVMAPGNGKFKYVLATQDSFDTVELK